VQVESRCFLWLDLGPGDTRRVFKKKGKTNPGHVRDFKNSTSVSRFGRNLGSVRDSSRAIARGVLGVFSKPEDTRRVFKIFPGF